LTAAARAPLAGDLREVVVVVQGPAEVEDPEHDETKWKGDEREFDNRSSPFASSESREHAGPTETGARGLLRLMRQQ